LKAELQTTQENLALEQQRVMEARDKWNADSEALTSLETHLEQVGQLIGQVKAREL
jgi:hypothetical protein